MPSVYADVTIDHLLFFSFQAEGNQCSIQEHLEESIGSEGEFDELK